MKKFSINDTYLTDVTVREDFVPRIDSENITPDQLIEVIKNSGRCYSIGTKDHPEFAKLRNQLEQQGYIVTQRSWWNGDRVLRPFTLNGIKFRKHDQFPCAAAMGGHLKFAKKYQRKKGGHDA
jgi:hypothetical protein